MLFDNYIFDAGIKGFYCLFYFFYNGASLAGNSLFLAARLQLGALLFRHVALAAPHGNPGQFFFPFASQGASQSSHP